MEARPFWVKLDIFNVSIKFYFGTKHRKGIEKIIGEKAPVDIIGFSNGNIVWLGDEADTDALVHEIYHSVCWIKSHVGIKDEETEAYLMSYLFAKTVVRFNRWKTALKGE